MKFSIFNFQFSKKIIWVLLFGIVVLAAILRLWQLGHIPLSPDWDEVSLGYNAYSIYHTGRDEYGTFLPIVLRSFGDYKPALYSYVTIPSIAVFGLNVFAIRLPSAIFGIITVLCTFFLVKELFRRQDIALLSSFLLAISPWHIQFSRVAFETNLGLALNVIAALIFLYGLRKYWLLPVCALIFALVPYAYQSEKVFTPLLVIFLCILFWKELFRIPKKWLIGAVLVGAVVILPMGIYTLFGTGALSRAQGVSIFSSTATLGQSIVNRYEYNKAHHDYVGLLLDNKRFLYLQNIIANYLSHMSLNWLFIMGDNERHHAPNMGIIYLWELPFILIGIYMCIFEKFEKKTKIFIFGWFLLAAIPASVTVGVPHAVRTLNFLPTFQVFSAVGIIWAYSLLRKRKIMGVISMAVVIVVASLNILYYLDQYFVQLNYYDASGWQYGYEKIVPDIAKMGKRYDHIVVTSKGYFGQSYIFFLFYLKYDPALYQKQNKPNDLGIESFGKYIFWPINWPNDSRMKNTLFVGNPDDFTDPVNGVKKVYYDPDGTLFGKVVATNP